MAYKFPWTNYHELNLDWILEQVKKLFAQTERNNEIVTQYDDRLTEVELIADNAAEMATQAQSDSTAALSIAATAQQTAATAQQTATAAQTEAVRAQQTGAAAQQTAEQAQQTAEQAQQVTQNFNGRLTQAETNIAAALRISEATAEELEDLADNVTALSEAVDKKADVIYNTVSGEIASFTDGADNMPIKSFIANIEPQQDLHGYDAPWPAGGGKNLFDVDSLISGGITGQGRDAANSDWRRTPYMYMKAGTYTISRASADWWKMFKYSEQSTSSVIGQVFNNNTHLTETFTLDTDCYCRFGFDYIPTTADAIQLEAGSTATAYVSYSNECPISGWTGLSGWVEDEYDPTEQPTFSVNWQDTAGTVYGGTLNVLTGVLTIDAGKYIVTGTEDIQTQNGYFRLFRAISGAKEDATKTKCSDYPVASTFSRTSIYLPVNDSGQGTVYFPLDESNRFANVTEFKMYLASRYQENNPIEIIYPLAQSQIYHLTAHQFNTLLGNNAVFIDCGSVSVTYPADTKLYIDNKFTELQALILEH